MAPGWPSLSGMGEGALGEWEGRPWETALPIRERDVRQRRSCPRCSLRYLTPICHLNSFCKTPLLLPLTAGQWPARVSHAWFWTSTVRRNTDLSASELEGSGCFIERALRIRSILKTSLFKKGGRTPFPSPSVAPCPRGMINLVRCKLGNWQFTTDLATSEPPEPPRPLSAAPLLLRNNWTVTAKWWLIFHVPLNACKNRTLIRIRCWRHVRTVGVQEIAVLEVPGPAAFIAGGLIFARKYVGSLLSG